MNDVANTAAPAAAPTAPTNTALPVAGAAPEGQTAKPLKFGDIDDAMISNLSKETGEKPAKKDPKSVTVDEDDDLDSDTEDDDTEDESDEDDQESEDEDDLDEEESEKEESEDEGTEEDNKKKYKIKVDGEEKTYSLQELKNIASSGLHTLKKQQAFEAEKTQIIGELNKKAAKIKQFDDAMNPIWDKLNPKEGKKDLPGAFIELASSAGMNKLQVERNLLNHYIPVVADYLGVSPEFVKQRIDAMKPRNASIEAQREAAFFREENEKLKKSTETKEPTGEDKVFQELTQLQSDHGVSRKEMERVTAWIGKNMPDKDLTANDVINIVLNYRTVDKVFEAIAIARPSLVKDPKFTDLAVRKFKANPTWDLPRLTKWVERKSKEYNQSKQPDEKTIHADISKKVLKSTAKSGFENPTGGQKKAMRFSDLDGDQDLV